MTAETQETSSTKQTQFMDEWLQRHNTSFTKQTRFTVELLQTHEKRHPQNKHDLRMNG